MITINFAAQLNDANIAEARANIGGRTYAAPCIIGAMVPKQLRRGLDSPACRYSADIRTLVDDGRVAFTNPEHLNLALNLQEAFDRGDLASVRNRL